LAWVPALEDEDGQDRHVLRHVFRNVVRRVLHVPVLHVSPKDRRLGRNACVWRGFRRWKMRMDK